MIRHLICIDCLLYGHVDSVVIPNSAQRGKYLAQFSHAFHSHYHQISIILVGHLDPALTGPTESPPFLRVLWLGDVLVERGAVVMISVKANSEENIDTYPAMLRRWPAAHRHPLNILDDSVSRPWAGMLATTTESTLL